MSFFEFSLFYVNTQTVLACFALCLILSIIFKRQKNLPPGPWSLPLLGNLPLLVMNMYRTELPEHMLADMSKKYGKVFSLKIGTTIIVVINGYRYIKEAFKNPNINDRPASQLFEDVGLDEGLAVSSGKSWKYQRVFTVNALRSFGVGRSQFEGNIIKEAKILVDAIHNEKDERLDPHILVGNCVSNVTCSVVFGKRYDNTDPDFRHLLLLLYSMQTKLGSGSPVAFLPIAKYIFPGYYKDLSSIFSELVEMIQAEVDQHRRNFDQENLDDFIDVFLNEIDLAKKETGDRDNYIHLKSLTATATTLFIAGIEPTTTTLRWALLYMMVYPEVQANVHHEMDTVISRTRMPQWSDRSLLPYTQAVLLEIQRIRTIIALLTHVASDDTKIAGYDIPKEAIVVANVWQLHNDPDIWTKPDQFNPERFLDDDGKLCHREELIPFGTGNRVCIGDSLAKMEIFLIFTYILHSFIITQPHDTKPPSMKGIGGGNFRPASYQLIAKPR